MEQEIDFSVRVLNGFLSLMIVGLVSTILAVIASLILWAIGYF